MKSEIKFSVTPEIVHDFAELTGDISSLHTDSMFARRSLYGETVAHGMLPLMGLALSPALRRTGERARLQKLAATFQNPVFVHDELVLSVESDGVGSSAFTIFRVDSSVPVSQGKVAWVQLPKRLSDSDSATGGGAPSRTMLCGSVEQQNRTFPEIERGDHAEFSAILRPDHEDRLVELLAKVISPAGEDIDLQHLREEVDLGAFLAASLSSTMVGVCLPGKTATFLGFDLDFCVAGNWPGSLRVKTKVKFLSSSTQTIVERFSVGSAGEEAAPLVSGKLKVRVNEPHTRMASLTSLAEKHLDLGLKEKVVLITGASRGLGETTAKLFSLHGSRVVVNYHRGAEDAERVADEIRNHGGTAVAVCADVTDKGQVRAMVGVIEEQFGPVEVLVNNAVRKPIPTDFINLTWDVLQGDLDVVLKGALNCCQAVLPGMVERRFGKIVNMGTLFTDVPPSQQSSYVMAKSALTGLTRSLAVELAPHDIQVNMVSPGMANTDLSSGVSRLVRNRIIAATPMNRLVNPEEVAKAVVMLASSQASFTTGQRLMVSGGLPPNL